MSVFIDNTVLERLLQRAKSGNEAGMSELCDVVRVRLLSLVRYKVRSWSREDHEDLVQETLTIFVRDLMKIEHSPLIYAHAILQKRIWNEMAKARRSKDVSLERRAATGTERERDDSPDGALWQDHAIDVADDIERKTKLERVWTAIQALNHEFCKPLLTAIMEGYDIGELWTKFSDLYPHLNRNAFYKRIFDCRKRLWEQLGGVL
jgi:DNA-directed RNA polymerase specialized sigma24 family protein